MFYPSHMSSNVRTDESWHCCRCCRSFKSNTCARLTCHRCSCVTYDDERIEKHHTLRLTCTIRHYVYEYQRKMSVGVDWSPRRGFQFFVVAGNSIHFPITCHCVMSPMWIALKIVWSMPTILGQPSSRLLMYRMFKIVATQHKWLSKYTRARWLGLEWKRLLSILIPHNRVCVCVSNYKQLTGLWLPAVTQNGCRINSSKTTATKTTTFD